MYLFGQYMRMHLKAVGIYILFFGICIIAFLLYHIPISVVVYTGGLCSFIGILILLSGFPKFYKKYNILLGQLQKISYEIEEFPDTKCKLEEIYQQMLEKLYREKTELENEQNAKYTDLVDYYTAWVHQIKTPIAAMRLKLSQEDSMLSRELRGELQKIEQYVEMVLCYLRLDSDSTDYVIQKYDMDSIVKQTVKKFAPQFISRKIQLKYQSVHCTVLTDEKWLIFVLEQLLSNALKYTHKGVISIYLEKSQTLCVEDTGVGISMEDLPRIFEKGYTGYNGRMDKTATGLGLYLCKRICDNLGHRLSVESKLNVGTTVRVQLTETENFSHSENNLSKL